MGAQVSRSKREPRPYYPCGSTDCSYCRKETLRRAQRQTAEKELREDLEPIPVEDE